ncbi:hypothetical protein M011DRAFT_492762 [Sporormia fimetaria CBS 119925]|uniref:Defect at low temperature protein 1 n=1 Tax=Sporormia fimetaria CBS 119925 TaxID=1340428 RepID=A0A6A6VKM9_9PLEO|nr:hypothetical protein M011DRAFT_492762 [Sporormia fimetaria CBS 119925]
MHIRIPTLFRIWYSTTYTIVFCLLLVFLAITPSDTIYQSIRTSELQKLFIIGGVYVLTFLVSLLVYSTRLYTNRTVLQAIPKPYIPVEDGEVGKLVRRMIVKALRRSAIIAWDSTPRDLTADGRADEEPGERPQTEGRPSFVFRRRSHARSATVIPISSESPPWGHVSHPGWESPSSANSPNLQYSQVVAELPNLIEAKAVSLAPPDPAVEDHLGIQGATPVLPDARVVTALQRPRTMGLRDYLARLTSYGMINPPILAPKFLAQYEYARFSAHALTAGEFQTLMAMFSEVLNSMREVDPELVEEIRLSERSDSRSFSSSSATTTRTGYYTLPRSPSVTSERSASVMRTTVQDAVSERSIETGSVIVRSGAPRTPSEKSLASGTGSVIVRNGPRSPSTLFPNSSLSSLDTHSVQS